MPEFQPIPDPSGALGPPDRYPPTAVATEAPVPPEKPRHGARIKKPPLLRALLLPLALAFGVARAVRRSRS